MTLDTLKERCESPSHPICFNDFRVALIEHFGPGWWSEATRSVILGEMPRNCPDWLQKELNGRLRTDDMMAIRILLGSIDQKLDKILHGH